ncbi:hypothetical protein DPEC_G00287370 [Dallia pectoralis]|uniref:Uncharacterized protein n=1 Tax=Dallia pectoralis TaxID=75939 RepID=A0ACC2FKL7_DALPE|nr:hypothetical protein DPEC_G00287370 [Dallia pectoralis]
MVQSRHRLPRDCHYRPDEAQDLHLHRMSPCAGVSGAVTVTPPPAMPSNLHGFMYDRRVGVGVVGGVVGCQRKGRRRGKGLGETKWGKGHCLNVKPDQQIHLVAHLLFYWTLLIGVVAIFSARVASPCQLAALSCGDNVVSQETLRLVHGVPVAQCSVIAPVAPQLRCQDIRCIHSSFYI